MIYLPVSAPKALSETVRTLGGLVKQYDTEADADSESLAAASGQTWQNDTILLALLFAAELGADRRILYAGEAFALAEKRSALRAPPPSSVSLPLTARIPKTGRSR